MKVGKYHVMVYVLASKYSWNHFISEKYKRVQLFKLHFLAPLYTSASDCKVTRTFLEAIL